MPEFEKIDATAITLTWTAPKNDGGAPIENYVIEYRADGAFKWKRANVTETVISCRFTVKGLREKEVYEFRVAAENKAGVGPCSEATMPVKAEEKVCKSFTLHSWAIHFVVFLL